MADRTPMEEQTFAYFMQAWLNALQYGQEDAQEVAVYALRSHGHAVFADGYADELVWKWKPPDKTFWCVIEPVFKPVELTVGDVLLAAPDLYAYLGEDELGSHEQGLKQGMTPAGLIPLVAVDRTKLEQDYILKQLGTQAQAHGKRIRFVRYTPAEVVRVIEP